MSQHQPGEHADAEGDPTDFYDSDYEGVQTSADTSWVAAYDTLADAPADAG